MPIDCRRRRRLLHLCSLRVLCVESSIHPGQILVRANGDSRCGGDRGQVHVSQSKWPGILVEHRAQIAIMAPAHNCTRSLTSRTGDILFPARRDVRASVIHSCRECPPWRPVFGASGPAAIAAGDAFPSAGNGTEAHSLQTGEKWFGESKNSLHFSHGSLAACLAAQRRRCWGRKKGGNCFPIDGTPPHAEKMETAAASIAAKCWQVRVAGGMGGGYTPRPVSPSETAPTA